MRTPPIRRFYAPHSVCGRMYMYTTHQQHQQQQQHTATRTSTRPTLTTHKTPAIHLQARRWPAEKRERTRTRRTHKQARMRCCRVVRFGHDSHRRTVACTHVSSHASREGCCWPRRGRCRVSSTSCSFSRVPPVVSISPVLCAHPPPTCPRHSATDYIILYSTRDIVLRIRDRA